MHCCGWGKCREIIIFSTYKTTQYLKILKELYSDLMEKHLVLRTYKSCFLQNVYYSYWNWPMSLERATCSFSEDLNYSAVFRLKKISIHPVDIRCKMVALCTISQWAKMPLLEFMSTTETEAAAVVPANDARVTKILIFFLLLLIRLSLPLNSMAFARALPAKEDGPAGPHKARTRNPIKASRHQSLSAPSAGKV